MVPYHIAHSVGQHDHVVKGGGALECDVRAQGLAQTRDEELNLMCFRDRSVIAGQRHEALGEVIDGPITSE
jgi:hypothetical protein